MKSKTKHHTKPARAGKRRPGNRPSPARARLHTPRIPLRWWLLIVLVLIWLCLPGSVQAQVRQLFELLRF